MLVWVEQVGQGYPLQKHRLTRDSKEVVLRDVAAAVDRRVGHTQVCGSRPALLFTLSLLSLCRMQLLRPPFSTCSLSDSPAAFLPQTYLEPTSLFIPTL